MTRRGGRPGSRLSPKAVEYWREYEGTLKELKQAANSDPAQFARRLVDYVAAMNQVRDEYIDYLRHRFGVEYHVHRIGTDYRSRKTRVVDPSRVPRTRYEKSVYDLACYEIMKLELFFRAADRY